MADVVAQAGAYVLATSANGVEKMRATGIITNEGLVYFARRRAGMQAEVITHISAGTSGQRVSPADTALGNEVWRGALTDAYTQEDEDQGTAVAVLKAEMTGREANGSTIREIGLHTARTESPSSDKLFARFLLSEADRIEKVSELALSFDAFYFEQTI